MSECNVNKLQVSNYVKKLKKEYLAEQIEQSEMYKRAFAEMCPSQEEGEDDVHASDLTHEVIDLAEDDESVESANEKNHRRAKTNEDEGNDSYSSYEGTDVAEDDESVKSAKKKKYFKKRFTRSRAKTHEDEGHFSDSMYEGTEVVEDDESVKPATKKNSRKKRFTCRTIQTLASRAKLS